MSTRQQRRIAESAAPWYSTQRTFAMKHICSNGPVAERLGSGLQNRLHRFDSGRDLLVRYNSLWLEEVLTSRHTELYSVTETLSC